MYHNSPSTPRQQFGPLSHHLLLLEHLLEQIAPEFLRLPDGQNATDKQSSKHPNETDDNIKLKESFRVDVMAQEHRNWDQKAHDERKNNRGNECEDERPPECFGILEVSTVLSHLSIFMNNGRKSVVSELFFGGVRRVFSEWCGRNSGLFSLNDALLRCR